MQITFLGDLTFETGLTPKRALTCCPPAHTSLVPRPTVKVGEGIPPGALPVQGSCRLPALHRGLTSHPPPGRQPSTAHILCFPEAQSGAHAPMERLRGTAG